MKPQSFLRQLVYVALPLGEGIVADPFMGSGSTIASAQAVGVPAVGVERHAEYYEMSKRAIPGLARLQPGSFKEADAGRSNSCLYEEGSFSQKYGEVN